jgi:hypothetical protein
VNNIIITIEYATGYVVSKWDDRMQILINVTSCGTLMGQALSKTAFAVTLLKLTKDKVWPTYILWFCIVTMNAFMVTKCFFQWAKITDKPSYDVWYRLDFYLGWTFRENYKEAGNSRWQFYIRPTHAIILTLTIVYNIIMDFVLATFPWIITWNLPMRKVEKIGLNVTMSLGMLVAIIAAIRTGWKDKGNVKDEWYFWRNAHSNIWYSSEIVGTIIVQCIPVLRPLLRDWSIIMSSRKTTNTTTVREEKALPPLPSYATENRKDAAMFSDPKKGTFLIDPDDEPDSWDNHGIYSNKEWEMNNMQRKPSTRAMV